MYQGRTGCQWAYLPHDLPQKSATSYYFAAWRDDGTDHVIHELLRCQVRERARRSEDPALVVLDTQSAHVAVCQASGPEMVPKNVEGTRAKLKRLVKLDILTEVDTGIFARRP
ncbi:hypothetical protein P2424_29350 [Streptomyces sp. WMMB303]|nr:hypothetical protein [Streptomyces sp. WMMB303]MDF4254422.1 hypothetical protein [Streptomyces sp. WMMB303]